MGAVAAGCIPCDEDDAGKLKGACGGCGPNDEYAGCDLDKADDGGKPACGGCNPNDELAAVASADCEEDNARPKDDWGGCKPKDEVAVNASAGCDKADAGKSKSACEVCNHEEDVGCEEKPNGAAEPSEGNCAGQLEAV